MKVKIIVDKQEKERDIFKYFEKKRNLELTFESLDYCDYILSDKTIVERKSVVDYVGSIDGLWERFSNVKSQFENIVLILEGKIKPVFDRGKPHIMVYNKHNFPQRRDWNPTSLSMMSYTLQSKCNVILMPTVDAQDSVNTMYAIAKYEQTDKRNAKLAIRPKRKIFTLYELKRFLVEGLPNIGGTLSEALLEHFNNSPVEIFNASREELKEVPKMGDKKVDAMFSVLGKQ